MPEFNFPDSLPVTLWVANLQPIRRESSNLLEIERSLSLENLYSLDSIRCEPIFIIPFSGNTSVPEKKHLSDLSPKDKIWNKHRAASDLVRDSYLRLGYERYAERIDECSTLLEFGKILSNDEFVYKLLSAHFCRHRHCIICQWRKTLKWTARFFKVIPTILKTYPKHRFIFLTLTIKNCDVTELRETINLMNKAWKRLIQSKSFPAEGFVKSLEVTRVFDCWDAGRFVGTHGKTWVDKWEKENKRKLRLLNTNYAHPHFHILMMVPSGYFTSKGGYLSHDKWMELWRKCLRINYDPTVNIKAVKPKAETSLVDTLREVLKYSLKPEDLIVDTKILTPTQVKNKDEWLGELTKQLHQTRAISLGGIFKNYLSDDEPDNLIDINEQPDGLEILNERYLFDWIEDLKQYIQRRDI